MDISLPERVTLAGGDRSRIAAVRKNSMKSNSKRPVSYPSAGSTFKKALKDISQSRLIEEAGLKGVAIGGAQVSTLHSGFIINKGGATATDIINLITLVQYGYDKKECLQPEVRDNWINTKKTACQYRMTYDHHTYHIFTWQGYDRG